ncbi:BlaI/MecI/CopY family transcriptional regulator [Microbulbifer halophilus]|uniref:BlaI/MecI/CopY family transcriptional regulator n=1 Tax=Microbulbifer halophilus TaxID=453963 RepID=A0ABW5ECB5_9GAMM|nr:BlaI/MecI/CopY family transcriptional regulator [Microbulbifer halophilus]MCW8125371.1 BlaI/MecI/CopY family transcriptional regulator [Microbulbifer halophilus]
MARKRSEQLTDGEQGIMEILWERGESSVKDIAGALAAEKPVAYTTVQTMCKILAEKGHADFRKEGRAFIYRARMSRTEARQSALKNLLNRFFGSSPELLAQHLMRETDIELKDLEALQKKIDETD